MSLVMSPTLETVEDAMVAALLADTAIDAYIKKVASFAGSWKQALVETLKQGVPAILVIYTGGEDERMGLEYSHDSHWTVLCICKSLRGEKRRRQGDGHATEVGAYGVLQDVRRVLADNDLGLDGLGRFQLRRAEVVDVNSEGNGRSWAVYSQELTAGIDVVFQDDSLSEMTGADMDFNAPDSDGTWTDPTTEATVTVETS